MSAPQEHDIYYTLTQAFAQLHDFFIDVDRIPILICALLICIVVGMVTGPFMGNANPALWSVLDILFGKMGDKANKPQRGHADLVFRGFILNVIILMFFYGVGVGLFRSFGGMFFIEAFLVSLAITSGAVWFSVLRLYFALAQQGKAEGAYYAISKSTHTNLNTTDDYGIAREGIAFTAISFDKGLVAPALWYVIGGLPALYIYSGLAAAAWRFGKCGHGGSFGATFMALERLMGYMMSYIAGYLFTCASLVAPSARFSQALKQWWQSRGKAPYEEGGVALSALVWPLQIIVGGAVQDLTGYLIKKAWIGPEGATAKVEHYHLKRAIVANVIAHLFFVLILTIMYWYGSKIAN